MAKATTRDVSIEIPEPSYGQIGVTILGSQPIILNRLAEKARRELVLPEGRKTAAAKASRPKHDPLAEFRASPYRLTEDDAPTLLAHLGSALKAAMMTAALDLPGSTKTQVGRLVWVVEERIPIWGEPQMLMSVTRSADINRTPDIRTRVIVPRWAARATVQFMTPLLNEVAVGNLLVGAGLSAGLGDWRPEKGKGTYGQFRLVNADDPDVAEVCKADRAVQIEAMETPVAYDDETAELFAWVQDEYTRRGFTGEAAGGDESE
jgi:hypothetical protein